MNDDRFTSPHSPLFKSDNVLQSGSTRNGSAAILKVTCIHSKESGGIHHAAASVIKLKSFDDK